MSSSTFALLQLSASAHNNDTKPLSFEIYEWVSNESCTSDTFANIGRSCDTIRELVLYIYLPALTDGQVWKDDLLLTLLDKVEIKYYNHGSIIFDKAYFHNLIKNNLTSYSNKLLFYNLPYDERKILSLQTNTLIIPLKLANLLKPPHREIIMDNIMNIKCVLNNKNLLENNDLEIPINDITYNFKYIGALYDNKTRDYIMKNMDNINSNHFTKNI